MKVIIKFRLHEIKIVDVCFFIFILNLEKSADLTFPFNVSPWSTVLSPILKGRVVSPWLEATPF